MSATIPSARRLMSTLTTGWRFTLPAELREVKGWDEGTHLMATAMGQIMEIRTIPPDGIPGQTSSDPMVECYLGAGGKIIVPAAIRPTLRWIPGKRIAVTEDGDALTITPCCGLTRCRSCGSTVNVREVIPHVHLCEECWSKFAAGVRQTSWGKSWRG
jgi:bifunctional DNA-binding transcriptional regulator/antitoxin component of YhaV-PrlF toxin-antitoxin module